jgi:hypothetical protein
MPAIRPFSTASGSEGHPAKRADTKRTVKVIATGVAESVTRPTGAKMCLFSSDVDIWVAFDGTTAAVPVADSDDTSVELNPVFVMLDSNDAISVISGSDGIVGITWYE